MKCPICYRELGTFTHDPILLSEGWTYHWADSAETTLVEMSATDRWYKGFQQISELDVIEIQSELSALERDNLDEIDWTIFSPVNNTGKFLVTGKHIKEMRESVEKLLEEFVSEKVEYFNYDADFNHIIHPLGDKLEWTDQIENEEDWDKFQVKAIHIEELRHSLATNKMERWARNYTTEMVFYRWDFGDPFWVQDPSGNYFFLKGDISSRLSPFTLLPWWGEVYGRFSYDTDPIYYYGGFDIFTIFSSAIITPGKTLSFDAVGGYYISDHQRLIFVESETGSGWVWQGQWIGQSAGGQVAILTGSWESSVNWKANKIFSMDIAGSYIPGLVSYTYGGILNEIYGYPKVAITLNEKYEIKYDLPSIYFVVGIEYDISNNKVYDRRDIRTLFSLPSITADALPWLQVYFPDTPISSTLFVVWMEFINGGAGPTGVSGAWAESTGRITGSVTVPEFHITMDNIGLINK